MGGNLFDDLVRLDKGAFQIYQDEVCTWLAEKFHTFSPTIAYGDKPSFGDLDIVVQKPKLDRAEFEEWLSSKGIDPKTDISYNKDNISFRYQYFQTDLIFVSESDYETAVFYYSYNDLSNLIGRIAHKFGLKFGWDGLSYQIRTESGHRAKKLSVSKSPTAIYDFLGYDYERWKKGFDNLEAIFKFVVSTPFFDPDIFNIDNLNHQNKTRLRKREIYQAFIDWLETVDLIPFHFSRDKSLYLVKIHSAFPEAHFLNQLADYADQARIHAQRKSKFNGGLVMEWTDLNGKDIGLAVAKFQAEMSKSECFDAYLDAHSAEHIKVDFLACFKKERSA